ncbi:hypothetical protein NPIL_333871, partial [Nephila pilipes]
KGYPRRPNNPDPLILFNNSIPWKNENLLLSKDGAAPGLHQLPTSLLPQNECCFLIGSSPSTTPTRSQRVPDELRPGRYTKAVALSTPRLGLRVFDGIMLIRTQQSSFPPSLPHRTSDRPLKLFSLTLTRGQRVTEEFTRRIRKSCHLPHDFLDL